MWIRAYKITLTNGEEIMLVGQNQHGDSAEFEAVGFSEAIELPDASSIDDIIKFFKSCHAIDGNSVN